MIVDGIISFVKETIITKAIPKLISMFIPGAGFISAIISIYDTVMVFINKISKIIQVVTAFLNSIVAIAAGNIGAAAGKVESILAGLLSLAINFLAGFVGLGKVADKIMGVINKVRATVDKALDTAIAWIIGKAKALFAKLFGKKDAKDQKPSSPAQAAALSALDALNSRFSTGADKDELQQAVAQVRQQHPVFTVLEVREKKGDFEYYYGFSPGTTKPGPGSKIVKIKLHRPGGFRAATKRSLKATFPTEHKASYTKRTVLKVTEARRHIIPSQEVLTYIQDSLNGKTIADAKAMLDGKNSPGVKVTRLTNPGVQEAAQMLLRNFFNDVENLWVGNASENSSIQDTWDFPAGWSDDKIWEHLIKIRERYLF